VIHGSYAASGGTLRVIDATVRARPVQSHPDPENIQEQSFSLVRDAA
jgi:hypothetical protein